MQTNQKLNGHEDGRTRQKEDSMHLSCLAWTAVGRRWPAAERAAVVAIGDSFLADAEEACIRFDIAVTAADNILGAGAYQALLLKEDRCEIFQPEELEMKIRTRILVSLRWLLRRVGGCGECWYLLTHDQNWGWWTGITSDDVKSSKPGHGQVWMNK